MKELLIPQVLGGARRTKVCQLVQHLVFVRSTTGLGVKVLDGLVDGSCGRLAGL